MFMYAGAICMDLSPSLILYQVIKDTTSAVFLRIFTEMYLITITKSIIITVYVLQKI